MISVLGSKFACHSSLLAASTDAKTLRLRPSKGHEIDGLLSWPHNPGQSGPPWLHQLGFDDYASPGPRPASRTLAGTAGGLALPLVEASMAMPIWDGSPHWIILSQFQEALRSQGNRAKARLGQNVLFLAACVCTLPGCKEEWRSIKAGRFQSRKRLGGNSH